MNELQRNAYSENMEKRYLMLLHNGVADRKEFQNKRADITSIFQKRKPMCVQIYQIMSNQQLSHFKKGYSKEYFRLI